jgi:4'-phosphopantetheinyl transferase
LEYRLHPEHPDLPTGEVHVWRASRAAVPSDLILAKVLILYLEGKPDIPIRRDERGKPLLADNRDEISFNLSHSGDLSLVAISRGREVGVDVEQVKPERDLVALAERALGPEDAVAVRTAAGEERTRVFYELWTRHEARVKCLGVGLAGTPTWPSPPVTVENLPIDPGYAAAVAMTGDPVPIHCWTLG